jgi:hypothetical protein
MPANRNIRLFKGVFKINRAYRDAKEQLFEQSVNTFEANAKPLLVILPLSLTIFAWLVAMFLPMAVERLYEAFGFYLLAGFFAVSYFSFFLSSKIIFRPSAEELSDDTSLFAVFSACERKELRGLYSISLATLHTVILVIYLIFSQDLKWFDLR